MPVVCGVYTITNRVNGKLYVGSSVDVHRRWQDHRRLLCIGAHTSSHLQAAWARYGADAFEFSVVDLCGCDELLSREQVLIDKTCCYEPGRGYNTARFAGAPARGVSPSVETRLKLSRAGKKRRMSSAARAHLSAVLRVRLNEPDVRARKSAAGTRRFASAEVRARLSDKLRQVFARPEVRAKRSAARKGRALSLEHRQKLSEVKRGKLLSPEHRAKISASMRVFRAEAARV